MDIRKKCTGRSIATKQEDLERYSKINGGGNTMSNRLFKNLKAGLEDVAARQRGELELYSETIVIPDPPEAYKPRQIKKIREANRYSQTIFAKILNVSVKTVQSWESGQRAPSHAALRLLEIVDKGFYRPQIVYSNSNRK